MYLCVPFLGLMRDLEGLWGFSLQGPVFQQQPLVSSALFSGSLADCALRSGG